MNTTYALLGDKGEIIFQTKKLAELEDFRYQIKNRRTGKTTRALFKALASDKDVIVIVQNRTTARYVHVPLLDKILASIGFAFQYNSTYSEFNIYGRKIYFKTLEQVESCPFLYKKENFELIDDNT